MSVFVPCLAVKVNTYKFEAPVELIFDFLPILEVFFRPVPEEILLFFGNYTKLAISLSEACITIHTAKIRPVWARLVLCKACCDPRWRPDERDQLLDIYWRLLLTHVAFVRFSWDFLTWQYCGHNLNT